MEKIPLKIVPKGKPFEGSRVPFSPSLPEQPLKAPEFSSKTRTEKGFYIVTEMRGNKYFIAFPPESSEPSPAFLEGQPISLEIGPDSKIAQEVNEEARRIVFHDFYSLDKLCASLRQYIQDQREVTEGDIKKAA